MARDLEAEYLHAKTQYQTGAISASAYLAKMTEIADEYVRRVDSAELPSVPVMVPLVKEA